jgi:phenylalanyl-tRNA synthetase beta chain
MNLSVSYNWLSEYLSKKISPEELAKKLSLHSSSVERIDYQGKNFDKIVIGKILKIEKHPNADKLQVTKVDVGNGKVLNIICGGKNIYEGMLGAVALAGAKVKWHGEGDLVELKKTSIRGVESEGMICTASEIGLTDKLVLSQVEGAVNEPIVIDLSFTKAKPGTPVAKALNLEDAIFEIEVTSNRPDCMSIIGLAREASAIMSSKLKVNTVKKVNKANTVNNLAVEVKDPGLCPRYSALVMDGVEVKESPLWLKQRLTSAGVRPINNIVDITNYVMLEFGQPLHAFDCDKLEAENNPLTPFAKGEQKKRGTTRKIIVRRASLDEKILALDGREYKLNHNNLVIADAKKPIAIAGVMGGECSSVDLKTKTIVIESANFDPVSVRKTARQLNIQTDASLRFEKGLSIESTEPSIWRVAELVSQLAHGKISGKLIDKRSRPYRPAKVKLNLDNVPRYLSVAIKPEKIVKILNLLGFKCARAGKIITAIVPYWRDRDISIEEDLIEEVARIYGYHNLPTELPTGEIPVTPKNWEFYWEKKIKDILMGAGLIETFSYSFVSAKLLQNCGYQLVDCLKLLNPLSADWEYMRNSLVPSILQAVAENQGIEDEFKIFELSKIYIKSDNSLPEEKSRLAGAFVGSVKDDKLFYKAKGALELLFKKMGIKNHELRIKEEKSNLWQTNRSAGVFISGSAIGRLGQPEIQVLKNFDIKKQAILFDLDFDKLTKYARTDKTYEPIAKYPSIELDLAVILPVIVTWEEIKKEVLSIDSKLIRDIKLFDIFSGGVIPAGKKSLAFRVIYRSDERTLKLEEAQALEEKIVSKLREKWGAELRKKFLIL